MAQPGEKKEEVEEKVYKFGQGDKSRSTAALKKRCPALYTTRSVGALMEERELDSMDQEPGPGAYFGPTSRLLYQLV
jgi:hypothetical protein